MESHPSVNPACNSAAPVGVATIERLAISRGHNYFGHHNQPAGSHPVVELSSIECHRGRGVVGDRFYDYKREYKGQITFFALETLDRICRELELQAVPLTAVRRNVFTRGLALPELIGVEFTLQGVRFVGTEECRPCYWMDQAVGLGAEARLRGCGGLRARILSDGMLRVGAAEFVKAPR